MNNMFAIGRESVILKLDAIGGVKFADLFTVKHTTNASLSSPDGAPTIGTDVDTLQDGC